MPNLSNFDIGIRVNARSAVRNLDRVAQRTGVLSRSFRALNGIVATGAIVQAARSTGRLADEYTNVNARLRLIANALEDVQRFQSGALRVATETRTSLNGAGTLVTRLGRSAEGLGASTSQVLAAAQAIQESFRVSGSTATEAEAATIQLAQALGKGVLNGDELRSVLENNLLIAQVIANEFGVSVDQLKELGASGELVSARVFKAILEDSTRINAQFKELPKTFGDSASLAKTSFQAIVGELNKVTGASNSYFESVQSITDELITGSLVDIGAGFKRGQVFAKLYIAEIRDAILSMEELGLKTRQFVENLLPRNQDPDQLRALRAELEGRIADVEGSDSFFDRIFGSIDVAGYRADIKEIDSQLAALASGSSATQQAIERVTAERAGLRGVVDEIQRQGVDDITSTELRLREFVESYRSALDEIKEARTQALSGAGNVPQIDERAILDDRGREDILRLRADIEAARQAAFEYQQIVAEVQFASEDAFFGFFDSLDQGIEAASKNFAKSWLNAIREVILSNVASRFADLLLNSPGGGGGFFAGLTRSLFTREQAGGTGGGFRNGGDFRVGGTGGADSQFVAFRASPNETVSIRTPSQRDSGGKGGDLILNVDARGAGPEVRAEVERGVKVAIEQSKAQILDLQRRGRFK